jgi:hypothetical protein
MNPLSLRKKPVEVKKFKENDQSFPRKLYDHNTQPVGLGNTGV